MSQTQATTPGKTQLVKFAEILSAKDLFIMHKVNLCKMDEFEEENTKVLEKLMKSQLNPNERKKIVSKKTGKWLCMSDDNGLIVVIVVSEQYPERLGYKFIGEVFKDLPEMFGEFYYTKSSKEILKNVEFTKKFKGLCTKYEEPQLFDKLYSANAKVEKAKEKMAANLNLAMDNAHQLTNLEDKTGTLLESAKAFHKDAKQMENIARGRNNRMKIMITMTATGGGGVVLLPLIMLLI